MKFNLYKDVVKMYNDTYKILEQNEAENNILLSNLSSGVSSSKTNKTNDWFMATITKENKIVLIALMTPPYGLTLYEVEESDESLICLINNIISNNIYIPWIMTKKKLCEKFSKIYSKITNLNYTTKTNLGIYVLDKLNENINVIGTLNSVSDEHMPFIPYWIESASAFYEEFPIKEVSSNLEHYNFDNLYVLKVDNKYVSMAKISRGLKLSACISMVYTPPYFRKHGYATSAVFQLSKMILNKGFKECVLYADLDYSTSNKIYKEIGYKLLSTFCKIEFK